MLLFTHSLLYIYRKWGEGGEGGGEIKGIWDKLGTLFQNIAIPKVMWQCFVMDYELHENDNTQKS